MKKKATALEGIEFICLFQLAIKVWFKKRHRWVEHAFYNCEKTAYTACRKAWQEKDQERKAKENYQTKR